MVDNGVKMEGNKDDDRSKNQIETAVKFLQNPKVKETPLSQRKAFLLKKGLSEDEIEKAIELAQTTDPNKDLLLRNPPQRSIVFPGQPPSPPPYSFRLRDLFWVGLIGGSFGYLLVHLVKTYLLPYVLNQKDEREERINQLHSSVSELKENLSQSVGDIQTTLDSVQKMLQDQQEKVQTMSLNLSTSQACLSQSMTESYSLSEIKSELSSLKGLLLNRRQFPSPVVQSSPFPSIPAWQRNTTEPNDGEDSVKKGNLLETKTDVMLSAVLETSKEGSTTECNGTDVDTSSGTLELQSDLTSLECSNSIPASERMDSDQNDTSYSTMSTDTGSPNLSLSK
ncbi:peroxisomal membrane protein PEX14-like [Dendronephthya gigantea]|uniref:peroxisomal membrane protein PEX14-like n=1 Tax=Dendronephthya gigantea TaxID=151771 RepID=UPI00106AD22F|nr:peroxisomal membrane protein PEX14-like [Dendronephthya gigantea]